MTAFAPSNLPASVDTVEKLAVWSLSVLAELNPDDVVRTDRNTNEPVATVQTYRFANELTDKERVIGAMYLPLTVGWRGSGRLWDSGVDELSTAAIPGNYNA